MTRFTCNADLLPAGFCRLVPLPRLHPAALARVPRVAGYKAFYFDPASGATGLLAEDEAGTLWNSAQGKVVCLWCVPDEAPPP